MSGSEEIDITGEEDGTETTAETDTSETASATEGTTQTETEDTATTETYETAEEASDTLSTSGSQAKGTHVRPEDILCLPGRHIKAEDFEWAMSPISALSDIIIENVINAESSDVEKFLNIATTEQKNKILEILPLDLPLTVTLPLIEEGIYWKRMCSTLWPAYEIWRYSDNWKSMFVHRTVQELVENFIPEKDNIKELCETLQKFSNYVTVLQIQKLTKVTVENIVVDLYSETFDEDLDEIISAPTSQIYLDFEKVFGCFENLQDLSFIIPPRFIDHENFHFNIADFNCLFRGLLKLKDLKKFRISNRMLSNEQMIVIIKSFLRHNSLMELNFSYNFIDDNICDYIGKLLISECPLESLILKYNKITNGGAKSIAAAMSENSKLKKLDISLNLVGDDGGAFLARVLSSNKSIMDLDVSKNKITEEAGFAFASLVKESDSLRCLKIQENYLGEDAGKLFSEALRDNHSILELDVHHCGFSNEDEDLIHEYILRNRLAVPYSPQMKMYNSITVSEFLF